MNLSRKQFFYGLIVFIYFFSIQIFHAQKTDNAKSSQESIAAQAGNPNSPIIQFSLTNFFSWDVHNSNGSYNLIQLQPVVPIKKFKSFPVKQLVRITLDYVGAGTNNSGFGDTVLEHVFIPEKVKWGSWGVGYSFTFPTGNVANIGSGKWQAGPAFTVIYSKLKKWQFGGVLINSFSFAGNSTTSKVNVLSFQPIINRLFGNWYVGVGDFVWTYNWLTNDSLSIPLALQAGRITKIGKFNYNISMEVEYTAAYESLTIAPNWGFRAGLVLLLPEN